MGLHIPRTGHQVLSLVRRPNRRASLSLPVDLGQAHVLLVQSSRLCDPVRLVVVGCGRVRVCGSVLSGFMQPPVSRFMACCNSQQC